MMFPIDVPHAPEIVTAVPTGGGQPLTPVILVSVPFNTNPVGLPGGVAETELIVPETTQLGGAWANDQVPCPPLVLPEPENAMVTGESHTTAPLE
ncbi:MAG TPA: hypothetical protein VNA15_03680 [Candidatus Angelobacter sp.]|nr:hypothetical protein [Candidatus Angelobacter sp.]